MKNYLLRQLPKLQSRFNYYHKNTIFFEGGLGSQILNLIAFWEIQEIRTPICNLDYFETNSNSKTLRPWELDKFGFAKSDFEQFQKKSKLQYLRGKRDFLTADQISNDYWKCVRKKYTASFPFKIDEVFAYFSKFIELDSNSSFASIHIRRGDYLTSGFKTISILEYSSLLSSINDFLPEIIFVTSDSDLSTDEKELLVSRIRADIKIIYLESESIEAFKVHCLMRLSSLIITSNSTFSFTAALLGKQSQIVLSPNNFYNSSMPTRYNDSYRSAGKFFLWDRENREGLHD